MKLLILFGLLGVILAQYGDPAPSYPSAPAPSYPSGPAPIPWWPHHHHHHRHSSSWSRSDSRSRSRSHSREKKHKCHQCKKLKNLRDSSIPTLEDAKISYLHDKNNCLRAVVSCPFINSTYTLYAGNDIENSEALSTGFYIQRVVKCNKKGKWEAEISATGDKYNFKFVGCQDKGTA